MVVWDWSRDGRFILHGRLQTGQLELWALPLEGESKPVALGHMGADARFSPDGRWLAYMSDESGRNEI
jgi:eukaryotic-like serine/threonine-protein kinase